jgi:aminopeptidase N
MDALKRSMKWDEDAFGREYDLDLFMIVAVRDFNFGAMENKGLNIFNSSLLLADPQTATDMDYERIESVVAHEYFHNWTGDRITCRDWFQLCLKEGLTVFRDQSFSPTCAARRPADQGREGPARPPVRRGPGPLAHPVRPSSYLKIDNFYTATIYEKGSEVIRMLKTLIGDQAFRKGMDLYFERLGRPGDHGRGLHPLFRRRLGPRPDRLLRLVRTGRHAPCPCRTPMTRRQDAELDLTQATAPTPGQPTKRPCRSR